AGARFRRGGVLLLPDPARRGTDHAGGGGRWHTAGAGGNGDALAVSANRSTRGAILSACRQRLSQAGHSGQSPSGYFGGGWGLCSSIARNTVTQVGQSCMRQTHAPLRCFRKPIVPYGIF